MEGNTVYILINTYEEYDEEHNMTRGWWSTVLAASESKEKLEKTLSDRADYLFNTFGYLICDTVSDGDELLLAGYPDDRPNVLVSYTLEIQAHVLS